MGSGFTDRLASLANYHRMKSGWGTWSRTTMRKLMRLPGFSTFPRWKLVDRHGFAPCSPACGAGDLLNDRAAQKKTGSGGRNRTGALAAYEAAALPLGDPAIEKWHGVSVLPRARGVLEALLRNLAPAAHVVWFENWCGQPDLHRHPLIGTQASCSWTMTANERRGWRCVRTRAAYDKKEQTPLPTRNLSSHPQDRFTAVLSVFQAHLPVHDG